VVVDLLNGVDWYSLSHKRFMMNTHYPPSEEHARFRQNRNMVVGIAFLDDKTVVVGHNCGKIMFCAFGMAERPPALKLADAHQGMSVTVACLFS
jgi:hypothetical protein